MIAIIAAYAKNRAIGKDGKLPWKLINELHHFRDITAGNIVIMGRKTFESIGKPLKGRTTIVLSKNKIFSEKRQPEAKLYEARSIPESLSLAKTLSAKSDPPADIFFAGGEAVYTQALPLCSALYITEIDAYVDGDAFFPEFDETLFEKKIIKKMNDDVFPCTYILYTKKNAGDYPHDPSFYT